MNEEEWRKRYNEKEDSSEQQKEGSREKQKMTNEEAQWLLKLKT